jgi:hypothetical protein
MIGKPIQLLLLLISFIKQVIGGEVFFVASFFSRGASDTVRLRATKKERTTFNRCS